MAGYSHRAALVALALACAAALVPFPRGVAAQATAEQPPELRFTVRAFRVTGDNPLDAARTDALLAPFVGEYSGIEGLYEAANTLEQALAEQGFTFHRVVLPAQTLKDGTVVLDVVAFKLGEIVVSGNKHFSRENILRSMPGLRTGEAPRTQELSQQRYIANLHPSKQVQLRLKESRTQSAIDAYLDVEDSDPQDLFLGINNTGNNATGDWRILGGFQHSNLSGHDDQLTVSVTVSPTKIDKVDQLGGSYALPLYSLGGRLNAFVAYSNVDSGTVQSVFDVAGAGTFYGLGYTHFLQRIGGYTHSLTGGVDDKRFVNSVDFQGLPVGVNVRSRPFAIGYNASYEHAAGVTSLYLNYARNIPRGKLNDKIHYAGSRFGAVPIWDAVRFGGTADLRLSGDWLLRWRGDGQITGQPLISGEQFGAGGARSVRGYQEREISGDVGVFSSIEAWSPPLVGDARVIGFFDVAHLRNKKALALGEKNLQDSIASVGLGLRWFWRTNLSVEADVARALSDGAINTPDGTESGDYRVHVNAFYRF